MKKDKQHIGMRNKVESLINEGMSIEKIADKLNLPIGSRYVKESVKWYKFCIVAQRNQKKAIEKYPDLYIKAGKIAQQKHPWLGHHVGNNYGHIAGKKRAETLKGNSEYFSKMAKRLQEIDPEHSRKNMKKAHKTMKENGTFNKHQKEAAIKCMEKHPNQLKDMSKRAHELYPLALLALESRRKNYPYEFMGCFFDSDSERKVCQHLVEHKLIDKPIEGKNIHFQICNSQVDFFIKNKLFVEFHPPIKYNGKNETVRSYYDKRRGLLDRNGFKNFPLMVISQLRYTESKIKTIKKLLSLELD